MRLQKRCRKLLIKRKLDYLANLTASIKGNPHKNLMGLLWHRVPGRCGTA